MYVQESGAASSAAPTIVLLHGGGVGGWSWRPVAERLDDYHLLIPDLPGQGRSGTEGPFTFDRAVTLVAGLIRDRAHGGKAHMAGLSLGAQTLVQLLADAPDMLLSAFASGTLVRRLPGAGLVRPMLWLYAPLKNLPALIRANMRSLGIPMEYYAEFAADTRGATTDALASILSANMSFGLPAELNNIRSTLSVPRTLVTVGQREYGIMQRSARDLVARLPRGQGYIVRGAGHNWPVAAPELYARTLRAWITGAPLPAELVAL
jgi:pimeloyl-ACP methyl ester carboxylesterase